MSSSTSTSPSASSPAQQPEAAPAAEGGLASRGGEPAGAAPAVAAPASAAQVSVTDTEEEQEARGLGGQGPGQAAGTRQAAPPVLLLPRAALLASELHAGRDYAHTPGGWPDAGGPAVRWGGSPGRSRSPAVRWEGRRREGPSRSGRTARAAAE